MDDFQIFSGNAHPALAAEIATILGKSVGQAKTTQFSDGETRVVIEESARGNDVYIIQPTCTRVNDTLMELWIMVDALKRASVKTINAVIPYFGYARQDKKVNPREPITARLVADFLQKAGVTHVFTVDIHSEQIQGFFDIPMDHLYAGPIFAEHFKARGFVGDDYRIVSPDVSGGSRAEALARHLKTDIAILRKTRPAPNQVMMGQIVGDVNGKKCLIIDDMVDTAGTLVKAAESLIAAGALSVEVACTHPVLSGNGKENLWSCEAINHITCLNTIPVKYGLLDRKMTVLSVAPLIAEAIRKHQSHESVSGLFKDWKK